MGDKPLDLSVSVGGGLVLANPVMTASGTFGYGREYAPYVDLRRLGAVIVKGLSLKPRAGNPPPRIMETPSGMLNSVGLQNVGVDAFIEDKLPFLRTLGTPVIVNIFGESVEEYGKLAGILDGVEGVHGLEVNISCPNVRCGGIAFGADLSSAAAVTERVRSVTGLPVMVKLTPNVTDIAAVARRVEAAGAHAVSLINTLRGMSVDVENRVPHLAMVTGGLSGPAIKPVALRMVWEVRQAVSIPVIGVGGIQTGRDALEFLIAGASAVQVGTANFVNPRATLDVLDGITSWMERKGIARIGEIIGSLRVCGEERT
jgi:dihydroorotate dehydrogenase (NAD+) catalytic subunit